jgi:hypothetical protein
MAGNVQTGADLALIFEETVDNSGDAAVRTRPEKQ